VFPSFVESQGIVFIEAMATGRPVIGPNTGPVPEIIEDGVSGLLCNPHDPQSIAERVIQCLTDRALAARLGAAGRSRAVDFFSVERMVDRNLEFYEQVLAGKAS
jgi:glycosyltransferase involved in cell wall biosynthesis